MMMPEELKNYLNQKLLERGKRRTFHRGETIYHRGAHPQGLYYIEDGLVGLLNISANGHESLLRVFGRNHFFGHRSFLSQENYHATSQALKKTKLLFVPVRSVDELFTECPKIFPFFSRILSIELRHAEDRLLDITGKKVAGRIIESLIYLKNRHPNYTWTRKEIGEFCGAQTETVTRVLSRLEEEGHIAKEGREIIILKDDALLDYATQIE
jgi:CRP-like cAMP-binding protein